MSRTCRRWLAVAALPLALLVSAPSCGSTSAAVKTLAGQTGKSADDLAPILDDAARGSGHQADQLAQEIADSPTAQLIVKLAKDPGVEMACRYIGGRVAGVDDTVAPGASDWVNRMVEAQRRQEPVEEACSVAGELAGAL